CQAEGDRGDEQPAVGFSSSQNRSDLAPTRVQRTRRFVECAHQLLEGAAAMLVIFKLIEASAGWCEEHRIVFSRALEGQLDRPIQCSSAHEKHSTVQLCGDFFLCGTNEQNRSGAFA